MKRMSLFCIALIVSGLVVTSSALAAIALDAALDNARKEKKVVMLELGSVGCIPCEQMRPVMAHLSSAYKGKLDVIFVDVKKKRDAARTFRVFAIPTQVFLDATSREFHRHIGYYPYEQIVPVLKKAGL